MEKNKTELMHKDNEKGATMIEYVLLAALIAIALIAIISVMSSNMNSAFSKVGSAVDQ